MRHDEDTDTTGTRHNEDTDTSCHIKDGTQCNEDTNDVDKTACAANAIKQSSSTTRASHPSMFMHACSRRVKESEEGGQTLALALCASAHPCVVVVLHSSVVQ